MSYNIPFRFFDTISLKIMAFTTDNFQRSFKCGTISPSLTQVDVWKMTKDLGMLSLRSIDAICSSHQFPMRQNIVTCIIGNLQIPCGRFFFLVSSIILFQKIVLSNQCLAHSIMIIIIITLKLILFKNPLKTSISFIGIRHLLFINYSASL